MDLLAYAAVIALYSPQPVLLDGRCDPAEYRRAAKQNLGLGVTLYAMHGKNLLSLCASLPPGSMGSMDLYLQSPQGGPITNLHVSRQVGEGVYPEGSPSNLIFRNQHGWYGPPNAIIRTELGPNGRPRTQFAPVESREVQLSKSRFGRGPWRFRIVLSELGPAQTISVKFPSDGSEWSILSLR